MFYPYCISVLSFITLSCFSFGQTSKAQGGYKIVINLVNVQNDKVGVEVFTPRITTESVIYHIPKIVPGTYSEDDYGRFIEQFRAFDKKGDTLVVTKPDVNSWTITNATKLYRISYLVNDTYEGDGTRQIVFEPAGSNIQKDTNYVINNHCFIGYFDNLKKRSYEISVTHPSNLYGSTALTDIDNSNTHDKFLTDSYNNLVDNPFMYNIPDTSIIKVGKTNVLISVYSPNKKISAKFLAEKLDTLLQAQGKYLGGQLPVDKYAFILYLDHKRGLSGSEGALEHSYSSLYYYPERDPEQLSVEFVNHAAHEFFHIITPLTIHSEEIQSFDFNTPKMSRHLWLYEGTTEYHAHMVQVKYNLISPVELLNRIGAKITNSRKNYDDTLPMTAMSAGVLSNYHSQFGNVYQKGALVAMCLDLKLLQLSGGKYGIMNLVHDLSRKYGKLKGFRDDELFGEIRKLTYPEIQEFFKNYVEGNQPLPFEQLLYIVGVNYRASEETQDSTFSLGKVNMGFNPASGRFTVSDTTQLNELGKSLDYHVNDEIVSVNQEKITAFNANNFFKNFGSGSKAGDSLTITVIRKDAMGKDTSVSTLR